MNNTLTYKGYIARVEFDPRDEIFVGRVLNVVDSITFHASTIDEITSAFQAAINHYLADCEATGREPFPTPNATS